MDLASKDQLAQGGPESFWNPYFLKMYSYWSLLNHISYDQYQIFIIFKIFKVKPISVNFTISINFGEIILELTKILHLAC